MTNFEVIMKEHPQFVKECLAHTRGKRVLKAVIEGKQEHDLWYDKKNDKSELDFLNAEHKEDVLDSVEKKYLSDIIRPFRHNVKNIRKAVCSGKYFIEINMKEACDRVCLPYFYKQSRMYKGMKESKPYTLDELGL